MNESTVVDKLMSLSETELKLVTDLVNTLYASHRLVIESRQSNTIPVCLSTDGVADESTQVNYKGEILLKSAQADHIFRPRQQEEKKPKKTVVTKTTNSKTKGGKKPHNYGRREQLQLGPRPNDFLTSGDDKLVPLDDPKLKRKLYKDAPTKRSKNSTIIDAICNECSKEETVSASLLRKDAEGNVVYTCNNCLTSKAFAHKS